MTIDEHFTKLAHGVSAWGGWFLAVIGTVAAAWAKVRTARETAKPDVIEASGVIINTAFAELRSEITRQEQREKQLIADMKLARDERHKLANKLTALESYTGKLLDYARSMLATLNDQGMTLPAMPDGITIDELLRGPVALYQPGVATAGGPVTLKDSEQ